MKNILYYTILLVLFSSSAQAQWEIKYSSSLYALSNMEFYHNMGFVGQDKNILRSYDWGDAWESLPINIPGFHLSKFHIIDSSHILADGSREDMGYLIESSDAGNTWTVIDSLKAFEYTEFVLLEDDTTLLYESDAILYKYSLASHQSTEVFDFHTLGATYASVIEYKFMSSDVGFLYVSLYAPQNPNQRILKTVDGGNTWTEIVLPLRLVEIHDVLFANMDSVYLLDDSMLYLFTYHDTKMDTIARIKGPPYSVNRQLASFSISKNGIGFIGGGWSALIESDSDFCTIIDLNLANNKYEIVYDSLGLPFRFTHAIDDSTWIAVADGGIIMKTTHSGGAFPPDYPWNKVYISNIDVLQHSSQLHIKLRPNPSNGVVDISVAEDMAIKYYQVYNARGQLIESKNLPSKVHSFQLDMSLCHPDVYVLKTGLENGETLLSKLVKY